MLRSGVLFLFLLLSVCAHAAGLAARGAGVVVAVIDTGIDYKYAPLGGGFGPTYKVAGGWDFVTDDADPYAAGYPMTRLAEVVLDVAPDVKLLAYRVQHILYSGVDGEDPDLRAAVDRAVKDGADVILFNLDVRGWEFNDLEWAVERAERAGVVVVAPTGTGTDIASPAASEHALAVGATYDEGYPREESGIGPPRGRLHEVDFKPDVMGPGVFDKGSTFHVGTSAAAAYVTGVVAQLRELHPEWTPQEIKSALMTTAQEIDALSLTRGAGFVDPVRAATEPLFVSEPSLLFGVNPEQTGYWRRSKEITIENRSGRAETIELAATRVPAGAEIAFWPQKLEIPAGGKAELWLEFSMRNDAIGFDELRPGGDILLRGSTTWRVPWAVMRAAHVTLSQAWNAVDVVGEKSRGTAWPDGRGTAEIFVAPGRYDFHHAVCRYDVCDLYIREQQLILDEVEEVWPYDKTYPVELAARDHDGNRLFDLPRDAKRVYRELVTMQCPGCEPYEWAGLPGSQLRVSNVSDRYTFTAVETYFDLEAKRAFRVVHEPLRGVTNGATLRRGPSDYRHARLVWPRSLAESTVQLCDAQWRRGSGISYVWWTFCAADRLRRDLAIDYYATPEEAKASPLDITGVQLMDEEVTSPVIQSRAAGFLLSSDPIPSIVAPRFDDGEEIVFKQRPLHPFAFASRLHYEGLGRLTAFRGPLGEVYRNDFTWTFRDQNGATTGGNAQSLPDYYYLGAGRLEVRDSDVLLEVTKNANSAPSFTSLRVFDDRARVLRRGLPASPVYLQFSATNVSGIAMRRDTTRVSYRPAGSADWLPLPVMLFGTEEYVLWGVPAGDVYRADLRGLPAGTFDLRLEVEDTRGARAVFTHTRALVIANEKPSPRR